MGYDKKIYTSKTKRWEVWLDQRNGLFVAQFLPFGKDGYSGPFDESSMWRLREIIRTDGDDAAIEFLGMSFDGVYITKSRFYPHHWGAYRACWEDGTLKHENLLKSSRKAEELAQEYGVELPYRPRFYATVETLQRFIRSKKSLPDFLHFQGKTWEISSWANDGKLAIYHDMNGSTKLRIHSAGNKPRNTIWAIVEIV